MRAPDSQPRRPRGRPRGRPGYDREAVLRRAIDVFTDRGYAATSIADIAADLGISKPAIFYHFKSKEDLLSAALDEALEELSAVVERAAAATSVGTALERLEATIVEAVRILTGNLPAITLLLRVRGNSEVERAALRRRRLIDESLATVVRNAAEDGDLRTDLEPEFISRLLFGMVNSLVDWYRPAGSLDPDAMARTVASIVLAGLKRR